MSFRTHLLQAIHDYLDDSPDVFAAIGDQHYTGLAKRGISPPYVIVNQISAVPQYTTGNAYGELVRLQVDVYATSDLEALGLADLIIETLDYSPLAINSAFVESFQRAGGGSLTVEEATDVDGEPLSRFSVDYLSYLSKTQPSVAGFNVYPLNLVEINGVEDL